MVFFLSNNLFQTTVYQEELSVFATFRHLCATQNSCKIIQKCLNYSLLEVQQSSNWFSGFWFQLNWLPCPIYWLMTTKLSNVDFFMRPLGPHGKISTPQKTKKIFPGYSWLILRCLHIDFFELQHQEVASNWQNWHEASNNSENFENFSCSSPIIYYLMSRTLLMLGIRERAWPVKI